MNKAAIQLIVIIFLSKVLAFLKDVIVTNYYGISSTTDSYLLANTISATAISLIMMGITTGYIPLYNDLKRKSFEKSYDFSNNLISFLMIISTAIIIFVLIFTDSIIGLFSSKFNQEEIVLAAMFIRVNIFSIYLVIVSTIYSDILRSEGSYLYSALANLVINISIIIFTIFSIKLGSIFLVIGNIAGLLMYTLLLKLKLNKINYKFKFKISLKDESLKKLFVLSIPLAFGVVINEINTVIDRSLASSVQVGGISYLTYGYKIFSLAHTTLVVAVTTVSFPILANLIQKKKKTELNENIIRNLVFVSILLIPTTLLLISFSEEIVSLIFGRGKFLNKDIVITAKILVFYSIGLIFYGYRDVISYVFYAKQDTVTPMKNAALAVCINIVLNLILSRYMGISGIALATSISGIVCSFLMWRSLKKIIDIEEKTFFINLLKVIFISLAMLGLILVLSKIILKDVEPSFNLLFSSFAGFIFYFSLLYIFNIENFKHYLNMFFSKFLLRFK